MMTDKIVLDDEDSTVLPCDFCNMLNQYMVTKLTKGVLIEAGAIKDGEMIHHLNGCPLKEELPLQKHVKKELPLQKRGVAGLLIEKYKKLYAAIIKRFSL